MASVRSAPAWGVVLGAALLAACGDDGGRPADGSTPDGGGSGVDAPPTGNAALRFQAVWGESAGTQIDAAWRDGVPGWEADATLVVMLCAPTDPTCEAPVLVREVGPEETDGVPLGRTTGPTVTLAGLPAGDFLLMVLADSTTSRARGYGWDDAFETPETAWGRHASEGDLLMSADGDSPAEGHDPPPAPAAVTLSSSAQADLGTRVLGHFHERDLSPAPGPESATLAVAVDEGVRLIDLSTYTLLELGGPGERTAVMHDGSGAPVDGTVCGIVRGPSTSVFLLYRSPTGGGFAVEYDVATRAQLNDGYRIALPGGAGDRPCRGLYHQFGGHSYLFAASAPAAPDQPPGEGLWYARISDRFERDLTATRLAAPHDQILGVGVSGLAARGDLLYVAISAAPADSRVPPLARGRHAVFVGALAADGRPTFEDPSGGRAVLAGPLLNGAVVDGETIPCDAELGTTSLAIAEHHDGRPLLFVGGCLEIAAFDLGEDPPVPLDFNGASAGEPNLDGSSFGQGFAYFVPSPDGQTLWAIPQRASPRSFFVAAGDSRVELERRMALPIDLSAGDVPAVRAGFAEDVDGYEGHPGSGVATPAEDPGLDLGYVAYQRYLLEWAPSVAAETFGASLDLTGIVAAPAAHTLFVAAPGGVGKASDLASYDLDDLRGHLWPHGGAPFYGLWTGGPGAEPTFGLDIAPESTDPVPIHGVVVVPSE